MTRFFLCTAVILSFALSAQSAVAQSGCVRLGRVDTVLNSKSSYYAEYNVKVMVDNTCNMEKDVRVNVCLYAKNGQRLDCTYISALVGAYRIENLFGRIMVNAEAVPYVDEARSRLESN